MSTASRELPRGTAWAVVLVTAAGLAPLAVPRPGLGAGALAGVAVAVSVRGLCRSSWWTAIAAAALPLGAFGVIVTLWLPASGTATVLTLVAVVVGFSMVGVVSGRLSSQQVTLVATSAAVNALALVMVGWLTAQAGGPGGVAPTARDLLWVAGEGAVGLATLLLAAGVLTVVTAVVLPTPVTASLRGQPLELQRESGLPVTAVVTSLVLAVVLGVGAMIPGVRVVVGAVAASTVVRAVVVGFTLVTVVVAWLALLARAAWALGRAPSVVALGVGSLVGTAAVAALAAAVGSESSQSLSGVLVPTALCVLTIGGIAALVANQFDAENTLTGTSPYRDDFERRRQLDVPATSGGEALLSLPVPGWEQLRPDTLIPAGLVGSAVVVALGMDRALTLGQVGVLVTIVSALFAHALFTRGRVTAQVVGVENVSTLPQAIWTVWTGALAAVGLLVGIIGIVLTDALTVTLPVPATAGVLFALVALGAGILLLVR